MTRSVRRLLTVLPPLLVLGGLAWLLLDAGNAQGDRGRARAEESIRARWSVRRDFAPLRQELRAYVTRYGTEPAARWFAVEAFAKIHDPLGAVETWSSAPAVRSEPGSAKKFASILLTAFGTLPEDPSSPTFLFPKCMQARIEAGDAAASVELRDFVRRMSVEQLQPLFAAFHRTPSKATDVLAKFLLERAEPAQFAVAGATLAGVPGAGPPVPSLLMGFFSSGEKSAHPGMWKQVTRALGTTANPEGMALLRHDRAQLPVDSGSDTMVPIFRGTMDAALALGGDTETEQRLFEQLTDLKGAWIASILATGYGVRLAHGDATVVRRLVSLWEGAREPLVQLQLGVAVLLADPMPPSEIPGDAWAEVLGASGSALERTIGHAWNFRRGKPGALDKLVEDVRDAARLHDLTGTQNPESDSEASAMEALRAMIRWG